MLRPRESVRKISSYHPPLAGRDGLRLDFNENTVGCSPQVIEFLEHLQRHITGKLLVIWDGGPIHRSRLVREYVDHLKGKIWVERLPAYAPELNPTEYVWGHFKQHELPNLCAVDLAQLSRFGRKALSRMRRRPQLVAAFWKQAELW